MKKNFTIIFIFFFTLVGFSQGNVSITPSNLGGAQIYLIKDNVFQFPALETNGVHLFEMQEGEELGFYYFANGRNEPTNASISIARNYVNYSNTTLSNTDVEVLNVGTPFVAVDDLFQAISEMSTSLPVQSNDFLSMAFVIQTAGLLQPQNGSIFILNNDLKYTSNLDFVGQDTFKYRVINLMGGFDTATVIVDVIDDTVLPVELSSFTCIHYPNAESQRQVNLRWVTASEINTSHFILEKSEDGLRWGELITMDAKGNSTERIGYNTADFNPFYMTYYRLKMVDLDESFEYSGIILITIEKEIEVKTYPNPVTEVLEIFIDGKVTNIKASLFDITGKELEQFIFNSQKEEINLQDYRSGIYFLRFDNSIFKTQKINKI